jgi:hypothetical protein
VSAHHLRVNVAYTFFAPDIETVQTAPDTLVHPSQLVKLEVASGVAVSVTCVAGVVFGTFAVQPAVEPLVQEISPPATVPFPVPCVLTVRR